MATRASGGRAEAASLHAAVGRVVLIGLFTGVETLALGIWLEIVRGAPLASQATAIGLGILAVGLVVEHVLTDLTVNGLDLSLPLGSILAVSASETLLWGLWLAIAMELGGLDGFLLAGGVLAASLVPQHTVENSVLRGREFGSKLVNPGTVGFSLLEALGATTWLVFVFRGDLVERLLRGIGTAGVGLADVGLAVLAVTLFVEHNVGVSFAQRR